VFKLAKKKTTVKKTAHKTKKLTYRPQTFGIRFDSLEFLILVVFVFMVAMVFVSRMMGLSIF
jgi:hypothetical protein